MDPSAAGYAHDAMDKASIVTDNAPAAATPCADRDDKPATAVLDARLPLQGIQIQPWPDGEFLIGNAAGKHLVAGKEIALIVRALCDAPDGAQAYARYAAQGGRLGEAAFLAQASRCVAALAPTPSPAAPPRLFFRRTVLSPDRVAPFANIARHAFVLPWAALGVLAALAAPVLAIAVFGERLAATWLSLDQSIAAFVLILLGAAIHEFGHAGALVRHGQPAGAIGAGLYLGAIPVFYADVSRAWRLSVRARVAVNLGGVYFQAIYATALMLLGAVAAYPALQMAGALSVILALTQFMPFARTDGYWVLSDLLRDPRLGKFDPKLLRECRQADAAGRKARLRLAYQLCNAAVVVAILIVSFRHASGLLRAIADSYATGIVSDTLRQPSRWLSLVLLCFLAYRLLAMTRRLANNPRSRRRPG